ncbi:MAG: hypothetical protein ABI847_18145 [Anaerolineales bacterium]
MRPAIPTATPDDHLTLLTRLAVWPLVVLSGIFGPMLFLLPDQTERLWAWPIQPPLSAVVLAAGYIFGAVAFASLLLRNQWHAMNAALATAWVFSIVMLAATLIHLDRFFVGTLRFDVWFVIYLALPFLLPVIWFFNRRYAAPRRPGGLTFSWPVRIMLLLGSFPVLAFGVFLLVYPPGAAAVWPWQLTPLMSRMISGWVMFLGAGACLAFFEPRYSAYRTALPGAIIWSLALLVGTLLHLNDMNFQRLSAWLWFVVVLGLLAGITLAFAACEFILWRQRSSRSAAPIEVAAR